MRRKEYQVKPINDGLFQDALAPATPAVTPGQAKLMALYPAGREMLLWQLLTGWRTCTVLSVRPEGKETCRITVEGVGGIQEVPPYDLKPLSEAA